MTNSNETLKLQLREDRTPLYLKIATQMRREIETGNWGPGHKLPTLNVIAEELGVALVTVRQAVALLEEEKLVQRHQGRGTFVSENPPTRQWVVLGSDWSSLLGHLHGKKPRLIQMMDSIAQPNVEPHEGICAPSYRYMRRVHYWDDIAYAVINIYLERKTYLLAAERFDTNMVISTLADLEVAHVNNLHQTFSFTTADPETSSLLGVSTNAPIGDVRRVITDDSGTILYVGETKYRGDFVKLEMNLER